MKVDTAALTMTTMTLTPDNKLQLELPMQRKKMEPECSADNTRSLFISLLEPVKKPLYNFVRKAMNFSPDSDDIFQEALLKGFRYFYSFDRRKSFKTWIFTIAHNLMKDSFAFKENRTVSLEETGEIGGQWNSVSEDVRDIYVVAGRLEPRRREIFFLYYYNEFKISEISDITGLSRANVKFILHQARNTVKKQMEVVA
jgi:RNA polymerase sigma-70 factor (ECF subfamily)